MRGNQPAVPSCGSVTLVAGGGGPNRGMRASRSAGRSAAAAGAPGTGAAEAEAGGAAGPGQEAWRGAEARPPAPHPASTDSNTPAARILLVFMPAETLPLAPAC